MQINVDMTDYIFRKAVYLEMRVVSKYGPHWQTE